jgi:hypothetical protein
MKYTLSFNNILNILLIKKGCIYTIPLQSVSLRIKIC